MKNKNSNKQKIYFNIYNFCNTPQKHIKTIVDEKLTNE